MYGNVREGMIMCGTCGDYIGTWSEQHGEVQKPNSPSFFSKENR